jgi:CBS domain containing-hemolysin-like protein
LEEIVGELESGDAPQPQASIERIDDRTWRVPGALSIRPLREMLGVTGQFADVDSIGGVVVAVLGRMPAVGDSVLVGGLRLSVDRMAGRRIRSVLLSLTPDAVQQGVVPR